MKQTYPRLSICNYDREKTSNFTNICHCWKYFPNPGMELTSFVSGIESRFLTSATWETLFERGSPFWLWTSLISGMLKLFSHYVRLLWPKGLKHIRLPALHLLLLPSYLASSFRKKKSWILCPHTSKSKDAGRAKTLEHIIFARHKAEKHLWHCQSL